MSVLEAHGDEKPRHAGSPTQPQGARWFTDCGNAAGTAHLYTSERDGLLVAHCGREILLSDRQGEGAALGYCKRCMKRVQHAV